MTIFQKFTLRSLRKNRVRTLVTIVGILLSTAMFTAVTTCISSLQEYLLETIRQTDGDWHGAAFSVGSGEVSALESDREVEGGTALQNLGYAAMEGSQNPDKPYLFVAGMDAGAADTLPIHLTEGRLPQNGAEILLPQHLRQNGGVIFALGDTLTLPLGQRVSDGYVLGQHTPYLSGEEGADSESLAVAEQRTYTVVGFYERPSFEELSAPGYTALTVQDGTGPDSYDCYFRLRHPADVYTYLAARFPDGNTGTNEDLLRFMGVSDNTNFNSVLYSFAAILIVIIVFGSISLIYNAFSISISERTRQFGLLSSIGATRRQMRGSVLFEALVLSGIGVPLGILAGIAGIGVTLHFTSGLFGSLMNGSESVQLQLHVSWPAVAVAAVISVGTVLLSAWLPARRAVKIPAIDAIRQTADIRIRPRQVKTGRLVYRLFGFEGMLASKNYKRNRRKYRATVVSLFMSVVLFISASSFCAYLEAGIDTLTDQAGYDVSYRYVPEDETVPQDREALFSEMSGVPGVTQSGYLYELYDVVMLDSQYYSEEYTTYLREHDNEGYAAYTSGKMEQAVRLLFLDDATYTAYLDGLGLDSGAYLEQANPPAVAIDQTRIYQADEGKFYTLRLLGDELPAVSWERPKLETEGYTYRYSVGGENGVMTYVYENEAGEERELSEREAFEAVTLTLGSRTEQLPFCVEPAQYQVLTLLYPYRALEAVAGGRSRFSDPLFCFEADDHRAVYDRMVSLFEERGIAADRLYDQAATEETNRALAAIIHIFSYGFITLISLIAMANVFNTISTNIGLRRREFAMLKSIGMTKKSFHKMMNFECLLYGCKGLLYGLPVSLLLTYWIYRSVQDGWNASFFVPWQSIVIAVGSVFLVVFATMLYSMRRINRDNPIDALKDENL